MTVGTQVPRFLLVHCRLLVEPKPEGRFLERRGWQA